MCAEDVFNVSKGIVLMSYIYKVIYGYIRFGPFVDMKYEQWSKILLLDKFGRCCGMSMNVLGSTDFAFCSFHWIWFHANRYATLSAFETCKYVIISYGDIAV